MFSQAVRSIGLAGLLALSVIPPRGEAGAPGSRSAGKTAETYQLEKLTEWRTAAVQHISGEPDAAAVRIGGWDPKDIETVIAYVTTIASQDAKSARRRLAKAPVRLAFDVTDQEVREGNVNQILKLGTLLHTDIALFELETGIRQHVREGIGVFADGRIFVKKKDLHWDFARRLIEPMRPIPSDERIMRQWFIATTAYMQNRRDLGYAGQNLKSALERFPSDERILFYAGVQHETWASPVNQNVLLPAGGRISFGSKESELKLARKFFQRAIEAKADFAEAHLRLGRVMGLLGDHPESVAELQRAAAAMTDPQLLYYAALYLGREFEALSRRSQAREQYERAAALYPDAQSPLLALSRLAHDIDDVEGALRELQRVFELPRKDLWRDDPWWSYDLAHVRDASSLVDEMRKAFGGPAQ